MYSPRFSQDQVPTAKEVRKIQSSIFPNLGGTRGLNGLRPENDVIWRRGLERENLTMFRIYDTNHVTNLIMRLVTA